jgi:hypothetical protein
MDGKQNHNIEAVVEHRAFLSLGHLLMVQFSIFKWDKFSIVSD